MPVDDWFHAETIEYVGLLKSVLTAKDRYVALELGAGWGPWLISGATAARRRGIKDIRLHGVEGDPEHFASMQTHFRDNGFDPAAYRLDNAAIGVKAGRARWPKLADPSDDFAVRPLACSGEDGNFADGRERPRLQGAVFDEYIDVEMLSFDSVLEREPLWDLVHIDVQGTETELCSASAEILNQRVRWLVIGMHSRKIDGDLIDLFFRHGWILENEKPSRFDYNAAWPIPGSDDHQGRYPGLAESAALIAPVRMIGRQRHKRAAGAGRRHRIRVGGAWLLPARRPAVVPSSTPVRPAEEGDGYVGWSWGLAPGRRHCRPHPRPGAWAVVHALRWPPNPRWPWSASGWWT